MGSKPRVLTERSIGTRIKRLVVSYRRLMALDDHDITVVFAKHDREREGIANCTTEPEYRRAVLSFDLEAVLTEAKASPDPSTYLHRLVRHELAHVGLWKLAMLSEEHMPKKMQRYAVAEHEACATWIECWPVWQRVEP